MMLASSSKSLFSLAPADSKLLHFGLLWDHISLFMLSVTVSKPFLEPHHFSAGPYQTGDEP